ncbi:MAG: DUF547 domain-containing protein [Bacteroidia bacterium]|nr:DUF547 domain-containing protein [Bacteroidia bacterium]
MKILILLFVLLFHNGSCERHGERATPSNISENPSTQTAEEPSGNIQHDTFESDPATSQSSFDHSVWNQLLNQYVTVDGQVDYNAIKLERNKLQKYISQLAKNTPDKNWSKADKLAYWINAYNALTVDLILRNYPVKSIKDIDDPWEQRLWNLGSKQYNLDEVEHQILRKMDEPRMHFAIVCASYSCPKLRNEAYVAERLDQQLTEATRLFLSDTKRNSIAADAIEISKIFQWFARDFKSDGSVIDFINRYTDVDISPNARKRYKTYNWALNE